MKRVRTLGLMLMAVFAMSAIAASAASAVVFEPNETAVKATSTNAKFTAPNGLSVECKSTVAEGKTGKASNTISASAVTKFTGCTAFGFPATVAETCGATKGSIIANSTTSVTVVIATGCKVVVSASGCSLTAEGKQELKGTWVNGNGTTIKSTFELAKAPVTVTTTGGICGAGGTGFESGKFTVEPASVKIK